MIATIEFEDSGKQVSLTISEDGRWSGPFLWAKYLNSLFLRADVGPENGEPYVSQIERIAKILGAEVVYEKKPQLSGETVY